eukprot:CAMPEP_0113562782 /NCGR_PEP_ID=MMETSP0015_2-20120614/20711_1 /TAXON_ID=2838 /ORGANISM="Odontella" /LENGTH=458 /DNA_ID=CAMNT_0000464703 /DNA_START=36 /DNA_END=1410 /DNA_ORIENTATION=- /assembly_acc=CAM_ASM_000160
MKALELVKLYALLLCLFSTYTCHGWQGSLPTGSSQACLRRGDLLATSPHDACGDDDVLPTEHRSENTPALPTLATRRDAVAAAMAGLGAEAAWRGAVEAAEAALVEDGTAVVPPSAIEQLESGRAVVIRDWLSSEECALLRADVKQCFEDGEFTNFVLSRNPGKKIDREANDRWIMPSFYKSRGEDGPFADTGVGNFALRQRFKARMAEVKAALSTGLQDRPTLADDFRQTHEMEYLRYGAGALLQRHVDEHHVEIQRPNGSRLPKKPNATRRSVTWMVYLNDDWEAEDGGQLRLHERAEPSAAQVGARGPDLQVGWLRAMANEKELPVFLDPLRPGPENENCMLYTVDASGNKRDLSQKPFANIALYLAGGDAMARKLMVDNASDTKRLHLIDAPKSLVSSILPPVSDAGEDGGERIRDIVPKAGTLVMFDSVSLPHEVLEQIVSALGYKAGFMKNW